MIYLLERLHEVDYDETAAFVIRAKDEKEARAIANERDYGRDLFNNPLETSCEIVEVEGESSIICRDFRAG